VNVSSGYTASNLQLPGNDNTFPRLHLQRARRLRAHRRPGSVNQDGYDPLGPASLDSTRTCSRPAGYRVDAGQLPPLSWLRLTGVAGLDLITGSTRRRCPRGRIELDQETE
jgi:hypothetical protein